MAKNPVPALAPDEIEKALSRLPGWEHADGKLRKEFRFRDFADSLGFVNRLLPWFEKADHHPDVHIFYSRIVFELTRHDIGGKVTEADVRAAEEIERSYAGR